MSETRVPLLLKFRNLRKLIGKRRECLDFLNSPRFAAALELSRDPTRPIPVEIVVDQGTTTEEERAFLFALIRESEGTPGPIVEIGTLFGFTTTEMALVKSPERKLITVDSFAWNPWSLTSSEHRRLAERVLRVPVETLHVEIAAVDKAEFYRSYDDLPPSLVFLDAVHTYEETRKDIEWALKAGSRLIAGHDYSPQFPGVVRAVIEHGTPEIHGSVWLLRR